ncbi:hypothetical protein BLOT_003540 [Blomia tropicalis]|nr:hypothetical protein BLOT_003540 [Blomia tropicalis]
MFRFVQTSNSSRVHNDSNKCALHRAMYSTNGSKCTHNHAILIEWNHTGGHLKPHHLQVHISN